MNPPDNTSIAAPPRSCWSGSNAEASDMARAASKSSRNFNPPSSPYWRSWNTDCRNIFCNVASAIWICLAIRDWVMSPGNAVPGANNAGSTPVNPAPRVSVPAPPANVPTPVPPVAAPAVPPGIIPGTALPVAPATAPGPAPVNAGLVTHRPCCTSQMNRCVGLPVAPVAVAVGPRNESNAC